MDKKNNPSNDQQVPEKSSGINEEPLDPLITNADDPLTDHATEPFIKGELDPDDAIHRSKRDTTDLDHETDVDDLLHR